MPIFEISSQNGCLFSRGAYFHGVLMNACNFLVARNLIVWERISCAYFRPRGSFSANFCPIFTAFLQPEIQSAIDRSLPTPARPSLVPRPFLYGRAPPIQEGSGNQTTPAHQRKAPGTNESVRGFWICSTNRPCLKFWFLSRVDRLLTIGDRH